MTNPADGPPNRSDHLAALKMHVDLANGEKQAIWTRHATMLVGNSIIVAALRSEHIDQSTTLFLNVVGLLLCIAWGVMARIGWGWFHQSLRAGAAVPVEPDLNPLKQFSSTSRWDAIFINTMVVVVIFALIYLFGLCRALAH